MLKKTFLVIGASLLVAVAAVSLTACSEKAPVSKPTPSPAIKSEPKKGADRTKTEEIVNHDAGAPSITDSESIKEAILGKWRLDSLESGIKPKNVNKDSEFTLEFRGGTVNGRICNSFSGPYSIEGGILKADKMASTEMACASEIMLYEDSIFKSSNGVSVKKDGQLLILSDENDDIALSFVSLE